MVSSSLERADADLLSVLYFLFLDLRSDHMRILTDRVVRQTVTNQVDHLGVRLAGRHNVVDALLLQHVDQLVSHLRMDLHFSQVIVQSISLFEDFGER